MIGVWLLGLLSEGVHVRRVNFGRLTGGILHSKFWIVDRKHVFIGSANMDWRALTQVCISRFTCMQIRWFQDTCWLFLSFRWRNSEWWSTTAPAWRTTCTRSSSPTGWWDKPTAPCQSAGPQCMTLPSTSTAPCWWKRIMSPVSFTSPWVTLLFNWAKIF